MTLRLAASDDSPTLYRTMRVIRPFLILLISFALAFTGVAASAMTHCAETVDLGQAEVQASADGTGIHADHEAMLHAHAAQPDANTQGHHGHTPSDGLSAECNHCSYCQSCASASMPPVGSKAHHVDDSSLTTSSVTESVTQFHTDSPFRPPRHASV